MLISPRQRGGTRCTFRQHSICKLQCIGSVLSGLVNHSSQASRIVSLMDHCPLDWSCVPPRGLCFFKKNNFHSTNALLVELSGQVKTADLSWHSIFPPTKTDRFLKPLPASVFPEK